MRGGGRREDGEEGWRGGGVEGWRGGGVEGRRGGGEEGRRGGGEAEAEVEALRHGRFCREGLGRVRGSSLRLGVLLVGTCEVLDHAERGVNATASGAGASAPRAGLGSGATVAVARGEPMRESDLRMEETGEMGGEGLKSSLVMLIPSGGIVRGVTFCKCI